MKLDHWLENAGVAMNFTLFQKKKKKLYAEGKLDDFKWMFI